MALILKNVTYKNIIKNINYKFENGKVYTILSSSEIEKEIFAKIIVDIVKKYSGNITINCSKEEISYVHKDTNTFIGNTCYEELSLCLMKYGYKPITVSKKIEALLKMLYLDKNIKSINPKVLSNSEKKLLSIGVALINNSKILVLNEPTLYLDAYNKKRIIKIFKKIAKRYNKIIIIFTNDVLLSEEASDNYILLNNGSIFCEGRTKDLPQINDKLFKCNIPIPQIMNFINMACKKKNISLDKTYDIKELMKDVYRNVK